MCSIEFVQFGKLTIKQPAPFNENIFLHSQNKVINFNNYMDALFIEIERKLEKEKRFKRLFIT